MDKIGILSNPKYREFMEKLNRRKYCKKCREIRKKFKEKEQKKGHYSNFLLGFSSSGVGIPIDVLIVGEAHGGDEKFFREQKNIEDEVKELNSYYRDDKIEKYHQQQMRELFNYLDKTGKTWVFTDLIKCFVFKKNKKMKRSQKNEEIAIEYCSKYLKEQIKFFKPKVILALGKIVGKYFKINRFEHGKISEFSGNKIIWSYFPSRNTADIWVKNGGWKKIKQKLNNFGNTK